MSLYPPQRQVAIRLCLVKALITYLDLILQLSALMAFWRSDSIKIFLLQYLRFKLIPTHLFLAHTAGVVPKR